MFGYLRRPQETAAATPIAAAQMRFTTDAHLRQRGSSNWYTPEMQVLAQKWKWYAGTQYDDLQYAWNGGRIRGVGSGVLTKALVPRSDGVPPGFRSMGAPDRSECRPSAPLRTVTRVVDRFTALLFGENCAPVVRCVGNETRGHWLNSFVRTTHLWARMQYARAVGGSEGAVAVGIEVADGEPRVEVYDPSRCKPVWKDRQRYVLKALEIRDQVATWVRVKGGEREELRYWVRRVISEEGDVRYKPVWCAEHPAGETEDGVLVAANKGGEPDWEALVDVDTSVKHDLGFCPVVWIKNLDLNAGPYGVEDCANLYEQARDLDEMRASIPRFIKGNLDPTLTVTSESGKLPQELRVGYGAGIGLKTGTQAAYLQANLSAATVAAQWFETCQDLFFQEADCLELTKAVGPAQTAFEVQQKLGPQQSKTALLREQYGQQGVRRLLLMAVKMELTLRQRGQGMTAMEPRVIKVQDGEDQTEAVSIGEGDGYIDVTWPPIARPTPADTTAAVSSATTALQGGVVDEETAVRYAASYFNAEDPAEVLSRIRADREARERAEREAAAAAPPSFTE